MVITPNRIRPVPATCPTCPVGRGGVFGVWSYRTVVAVLAGGMCAVLAGCPGGGFSTWPPADETKVNGGSTSSNDINRPPVLQVVGTALNYACRRFPPIANANPEDVPTEPFAINLPPGTTYRAAREICDFVHPLCRPLTEETRNLPIYHIARINVRGSDSEVLVQVPVVGMISPEGGTLYKGVRIVMRSGTQNWRVMGHSSFPVAVLDVPELNVLEAVPLNQVE